MSPKHPISKWLYWTPRIFAIAFIAFLMMFSLDVITPEASFWQIVVGMLMHNIPAFVLIVLLVISRKHEMVGAITFLLTGIAYIVLLVINNPFERYMLAQLLIIAGPAFLVGILFWMNWKKKRT